jgi:hypothetical protein
MSKLLLVILQNPYKKGELAKGWSRKRWQNEFERSHTRHRLFEAIPQGVEPVIINANPRLEDDVNYTPDPNVGYVRGQIRRKKPDLILACGQVAHKAMDIIRPRVLVIKMPHPTYRRLTKETTETVRVLLKYFLCLE